MHQSVSAIVIERQQQLDAVLHEISGLETVMDGIKNLHQQLVEKKDRITWSMNMHKGLISPLWRLPTEILSQIFDHCLPGEGSLLSPSTRRAPILLTGICRRWREVAVCLPSLWCRLYVEVHDSDWQRASFCYDSWLKRSRGCPLSLELNCVANDLTKLQSLFQPYIDQIIQSSSLRIHFYGETVQPELLLQDLPALQEVTMIILAHIDTSYIAQFISRLPSTLRSLTVTESFGVEHLSSCNSVLAHLTNLEIYIDHSNAFIHLLQLCPNLSSLKVCAVINQVQTLEPFTHTSIRSLRINFNSVYTRCISGLFDALSLPNLRVFEARYLRSWPHKEFKSFLVRSQCPLESLTFGSLRKMMTDEQRAKYVNLFPSIEVIVLHPLESTF